MRQWWPVAGSGALSAAVSAQDLLKEVTIFFISSTVVWSQVKQQGENTRDDCTRGHHQMVNTEIRSIIFFTAKDGEALYSQPKQDQELTVAQTMNSLLPNSDLN